MLLKVILVKYMLNFNILTIKHSLFRRNTTKILEIKGAYVRRSDFAFSSLKIMQA